MRVVVAAACLWAGCNDPVPLAPEPSKASVAALTVPGPSKHSDGPLRPHHEEPVVECPATISDAMDDDAKAAAMLDTANKQIAVAEYAAAWTCADRAADLVPTSVDAQHLRGSALAALGRDPEAQVAYSLALALDPDDPETLRAVADFYINGTSKVAYGRDAVRLGLELAQRGSRRVIARRRRSPQLGADLAVLEAQAQNDLGRSDEALARLEVALRLMPGRGDALHEKGVALFDLSRFAEAKAVLGRALAIQPDDAYCHQMLGLTLEQLGDVTNAELELVRALELAPADLTPPVLISAAEFRTEVDAVIARLPADRRTRVRSIRVEVVDLPDPVDLAAVKPPFPPTILGLYRGPVGWFPVAADAGGNRSGFAGRGGARPWNDAEQPSIVLYRKNLARAVKTRAELSEQIRDTLLHEDGHLEGLDEYDLRRRGME